MMEVVATRKVFFQGQWYKAGDCFHCSESDFANLEPQGVELAKGQSKAKRDKAEKEFSKR
jgi:hypothetical protein